MSLKCGLLGEKLGHSRSPEIHSRLGNYEYRLYEKPPEAVEDFLLHGDYDVINVTIPYKKVAFACCRDVTPVAAELGNVNVVVKRLVAPFQHFLLHIIKGAEAVFRRLQVPQVIGDVVRLVGYYHDLVYRYTQPVEECPSGP